MGQIRAIKVWGLFSLLIFLVSESSLSYAQTNTFPSDGDVGIGTTGPTAKLVTQASSHQLMVSQSAAGSGGAGNTAEIVLNTAADTYAPGEAPRIYGYQEDSGAPWKAGLRFDTYAGGGSRPTRMTILGNGDVGIGTASPATRLEISKAGTGNLMVGNSSAAGAGNISEIIINPSDITYATTEAPRIYAYEEDGSAPFKAGIRFDTYAGGGSRPTRMTILGNGDVGIGTTSPSSKLHVVGDAKITGDLTVDGNIAAKYQDVAEWVRTQGALESGTVVVIDPAESDRVLPASKSYDTRVAGVVSAQPGIILGEAGENKVKVAHSGRVKVKVDSQYGPVAVGDLLVSSPTAGYAMVSRPVELNGISIHRPGTIVGKALEPLKEGQGEILVLVTLQ